jgi:alpha-tubulin suppressor-like RCC1 family protein
MKRVLAVAFVLLAATRHAPAEDCACPRIQALAASPQWNTNQSGDRFNLAILPDGGVRCWGACPTSLAPRDVVAVAAGYRHALYLHGDGTVTQVLGGGSSMPPVPAQAQTGVVAIAAGEIHSLALLQTGEVVGWGVPSGAMPNANTTIPAAAQSNVTAIAAGHGFSLALRDDGSVVGWGGVTLPPEVSSDVVAIAGGAAHSLAVKSDGSVVEWSFTGVVNKNVPAGAQSGVRAVAAGLVHSLALRSDGTVVAWGNMLSSGCGGGVNTSACGEEPARGYPDFHTIDSLEPRDEYVPWDHKTVPACAFVRPPNAGAVRAIAAGGYRSLALLEDGSVIGWGDPVGYPLPSIPGHPRMDPPVPVDLVGPHCVTGLTGVRAVYGAIPNVPMGQAVTLDIAIDKLAGSQLPVSVTVLDAAANGVDRFEFKFPTGSAFATRERQGKLTLWVHDASKDLPAGVHYVLPTGVRTLRLLARSGDVAVESSFSIDVLRPLQFEVSF